MKPSKTGGNKRKRENETPDYSSEKYWDERYQTGGIIHEWYYNFDTILPIIQSVISFQKDNRVLELGCGDHPLINSFKTLEEELQLYAIDFSPSIINILNEKKEGISYLTMDARKMDFENDFFDMIIEKGTLDAMLSTSKIESGISNAVKIISEAVRVLKLNGHFIIVSHISPDTEEFDLLLNEIFFPALGSKSTVNWKITVHSVKEEDYGTVYVLSSTPRKITRNMAKSSGVVSLEVLEYDDDDDDEAEEDQEEEELEEEGK